MAVAASEFRLVAATMPAATPDPPAPLRKPLPEPVAQSVPYHAALKAWRDSSSVQRAHARPAAGQRSLHVLAATVRRSPLSLENAIPMGAGSGLYGGSSPMRGPAIWRKTVIGDGIGPSRAGAPRESTSTEKPEPFYKCNSPPSSCGCSGAPALRSDLGPLHRPAGRWRIRHGVSACRVMSVKTAQIPGWSGGMSRRLELACREWAVFSWSIRAKARKCHHVR